MPFLKFMKSSTFPLNSDFAISPQWNWFEIFTQPEYVFYVKTVEDKIRIFRTTSPRQIYEFLIPLTHYTSPVFIHELSVCLDPNLGSGRWMIDTLDPVSCISKIQSQQNWLLWQSTLITFLIYSITYISRIASRTVRHSWVMYNRPCRQNTYPIIPTSSSKFNSIFPLI